VAAPPPPPHHADGAPLPPPASAPMIAPTLRNRAALGRLIALADQIRPARH
jgi:hypothetical protein